MVEAIDNVIVMAEESVFAKCKVFFICHFLPSGNSDYALKLYQKLSGVMFLELAADTLCSIYLIATPIVGVFNF